MNGVAHYLFGLLLTLLVIQSLQKYYTTDSNEQKLEQKLFTPLAVTLIIVVTFFSHAFVDAIAHFTYHPSEYNWSDPVYSGWHLTTYVAEAVFAIYFLKTDIRYVYGMLGSVGFDLWDWSTVRPLDKYMGIDLPGIHFMADATQQFLFASFQSLRNEQWALIIEVIIVTILFVSWRMWHQTSELSKDSRPATLKEIILLVLVFGTLRLLTLV